MLNSPTSLFVVVGFLSFLRANAQSIITGNSSYIGGIPLRTPDNCPAGSVIGQVTFEQNCCGAGQTFVKVEGSVCCETSSDCYSEVVAAPKCADSSWQLCGTNEGGFCCEEDWVCYTQTASGTSGGGVGCSTPGATLSAGQSEVTTVYAANEGPDVSTTAAPSSSSTTSTSSTPSSESGAASTSSASSSAPSTSSDSQAAPTTTALVDTGSASSSPSNTSSGVSGKSSSSTGTKSSPSIGGGPIAGIVIGAILLLAVAFVGGIWFSRRKRDSDPSDNLNLGKSKITNGMQERDDIPSSRRELKAPIPGIGHTMVYEVGNGATPAAELPDNQRVAEMDAGYRDSYER